MHEESLESVQKKWHGTYSSYAIGFFGSLILTGISFFLVMGKKSSGMTLIYTIVGLALAQAFIQVYYFLHLGKEQKPRWETIVFFFMILTLLIVVLGTLWIMFDLDKRLMQGMEMHD